MLPFFSFLIPRIVKFLMFYSIHWNNNLIVNILFAFTAQKKATVSNNIINYFHCSHNSNLSFCLINGCCRKTDRSLSAMCCRRRLFFTILIYAVVEMLILVPSASGVCCKTTTINFSLKDGHSKSCSDFENAWRTIFDGKKCYVTICGSLRRATTCCGRSYCNIFCCGCQVCHRRNDPKLILADFKEKHQSHLKDFSID